MANITIPTPDNCTAETITVVYKVNGKAGHLLADPGINRIEKREADEVKHLCEFCQEGFDSKRSCAQHERFCSKNPNREDPRQKKKSPGPKYARCQYCEKKCKVQGLKRHENWCPKNPANAVKDQPDMTTFVDEKSMPLDIQAEMDAIVKRHPGVCTIAPKKPGVIERIGKKASNILGNLRPKEYPAPPLGADIWHWKYGCGVIVSLDEPRKCAYATFKSIPDERKFNYEGCAQMIEAWKERQKNEIKQGAE